MSYLSFHDDAEAQLLVDLVKDWDAAHDDTPRSDRLQKLLKLREQAQALGAKVIAFELDWHDTSQRRDRH